MFTQPDMRLDLADQIHRERLAAAERWRLAATLPSAPSPSPRRRPRRVTRAILALVGTRIG